MSDSTKKPGFSNLFTRLTLSRVRPSDKKAVAENEIDLNRTAEASETVFAISLKVEDLSVEAMTDLSNLAEMAVKPYSSGPLDLSGSIGGGGLQKTLVVKLPQPDKNAERKFRKRDSGKLSATPHMQAASWGEHALAYLNTREYEKALECAEQALRLDSENGMAWQYRGAALRALARVPEAAQALQRAVMLRPQNADAWVMFAQVLYQLELYHQVVQCCTSALNYSPHHGEALLYQARAYVCLSQYAAAGASFERALRQRADDAEAWREYGDALCHLNQPEAALECYERVAQIHPTVPENWLRLSNFLVYLGRPAEALAGYHTALDLAAHCSEIWLKRGLALAALGRQEDAAQSYQRVLELHPNDTEAVFQLALTFMRRFLESLAQGRVFHAKEHWQYGIRWGRQTPLPEWYEIEAHYLQEAAVLGHQRLVKVLIGRLEGNPLLAPLDFALDFLQTQDHAKVVSLPSHIRNQVNTLIQWLNPLGPYLMVD